MDDLVRERFLAANGQFNENMLKALWDGVAGKFTQRSSAAKIEALEAENARLRELAGLLDGALDHVSAFSSVRNNPRWRDQWKSILELKAQVRALG